MAGAPVCNNLPANTPGQPDPKTLPSVPLATDLASAITAVNALRRIMQTIIAQPPPVSGGLSGFKVQKGKGFHELKQYRVSKVVRIYNPSDKTQFVDVKQIVGVVMADPKTGQTWSWQR
jgi:hypothetical protein